MGDAVPDKTGRSGQPAPSRRRYDEAWVARWFRWSVVAVVLLIVGGVTIAVWYDRSGTAEVTSVTERVAPAPRVMTAAEVPTVGFKDVTAEAGITFHHFNGATGDKLLPETMGGGVAFFDMDGDGDADLLFVNSSAWPWDPAGQEEQPIPAS